MKVRKAVIPVAGYATRMLPVTKSFPKCMLPIVDKPAIHYLVEECYMSGIEDILIVCGKDSDVIEDYFDKNYELLEHLKKKRMSSEIEDISNITNMCNIYFHRQKEAKGLGHAVLKAKNFIGDEPFVVLYGDDVIIDTENKGRYATSQLIDTYINDSKCEGVAGLRFVPEDDDMSKYSSVKISSSKINIGSVNSGSLNIYRIDDVIEKPKTEKDVYSRYSIMGRVLLPPDIFDILEVTDYGVGGELQLTDAIKELINRGCMYGVEYSGERYDMGNKFDFIRANIENGLNHQETREKLRKYLLNI